MKSFFLPLLLVFGLFVQAQQQAATLFFRNGKTVEGFAKIDGEEVKFRKRLNKGKSKTYDYKELQSLEIAEDEKK